MKILGIDVGGTGIKGAIVDTQSGKLITKRYRVDTPKPATPQAVVSCICEIVAHHKWSGPIGVGFPAAIRHEIVKTASNIDRSWIGLNASELIQNTTNCPTHLVNDVDAAGLAEMEFGVGKGQSGVTLMVAAGTGIGTGLFIEKKLVPNTELGFIKVNEIAGENYISNTARENENLSWKEWGNRFNEYLLRLESLFWPDLFILGGGVSKKFNKYKDYFTLDTPLLPAASKNHAGIIGAALAAMQKVGLLDEAANK